MAAFAMGDAALYLSEKGQVPRHFLPGITNEEEAKGAGQTLFKDVFFKD